MNKFVSLHTHSSGSFIDGYASVDDLARRASELSGSVGLTDHGDVGQHLAFQKACAKHGVHGVLGTEGYLVDNVNRVKAEKDNLNSHLCILAENNEGLSNLWALSTLGYQNRYYKPLIDWSMLKERSKGLIVTDGCLLANMARFIVADKYDEARAWASQYLDIFGDSNFFMELHTFQLIAPSTEREIKLNADMTKMNQGKLQLSKELGIPLIVVNDAHYAWEKDWENHQLVWSMSTNKVKTSDQTEAGKAASWIMSDDEVYYWMAKHGIARSVVEEAINNTSLIADRCDTEIKPKRHIPLLFGDKDVDRRRFESAIEDGFKRKVVDKELPIDAYAERVGEELDLIVDKEFYGYFNIVADYCKYAKSQGWLVGPGRGSGGGSLIASLMDITEIDPIKYGLMFARFISPGRKDYPDIDLDFPQSKRLAMIDYLKARHGDDHIAIIGTLTRLGPKGILKDLTRAMGINFEDSKKMSKIVDQVKQIKIDRDNEEDEDADDLTWEEVLAAKGGELAYWAEKYPKLFDKINEMMGLIRQSSTHAAGVLISDTSLMGQLPMRISGKSENLSTQFEAPEVEELGYIKFDILGLRHLDTLMEAERLVNNGGKVDPKSFYDFTDDRYVDSSVWAEITAGNTVGISQLETPGMTQVGKRLKPESERDIATLISINRPGVIDAGMLDEYLERRAGRRPVRYLHPLMADVLSGTYGVIVYQEQAMKLSQILANYSAEEAEQLRKIMGKKLIEKMQAEKPKFIQRCLDNPAFSSAVSNPKKVVNEIWEQLSASQRYSFNEAHAQGYALVSSWGAYYKAKYPAEYITACMQTDSKNINKYIREARKIGVKILPPEINQSTSKFALTVDGIRYGLDSVDHVGSAAVKEIMSKRPFFSFDDFLDKVSKRACTSAVVANLISIGAFDKLGKRSELLTQFYTTRKIKDKVVPDFDDEEVVLQTEMLLVGNYITKDPADKYRDAIESKAIESPEAMDSLSTDSVCYVGGQVTKCHEHTTKKGDPMAFLDLTWKDEVYPVTVFPIAFKANKDYIEEGKYVICKVQKLDKGVHMLNVMRLDN